MMYFLSVESLNALPTQHGYYSLGIFASGFEKRSTYVPKKLEQGVLRSRIALGFSEQTTLLSRPENDFYFEQELQIPLIKDNIDDSLLEELDKLLQRGGNEKVSILIDYSVMTRSWYGLILNWARFAKHTKAIEIDFVYSYGKYLSEFDPLSISDIVALPGFEGTSAGLRNTVAIFGLGFDKYATLAVYDRLEPDKAICFVASRTESDQSEKKATEENEVLCEVAGGAIRLPLGDLTSAFSILSENIASQDETNQIIIVPMGPKPHVLVSLLVALRLPRITCLHVKGDRANPVQVEAEGPLSIARVIFVPN